MRASRFVPPARKQNPPKVGSRPTTPDPARAGVRSHVGSLAQLWVEVRSPRLPVLASLFRSHGIAACRARSLERAGKALEEAERLLYGPTGPRDLDQLQGRHPTERGRATGRRTSTPAPFCSGSHVCPGGPKRCRALHSMLSGGKGIPGFAFVSARRDASPPAAGSRPSEADAEEGPT